MCVQIIIHPSQCGVTLINDYLCGRKLFVPSFKNIETLILSASVLHRWILQIIIVQIKFHLLSQSFNCNKYFKFSIKFYTSNYAVGIETEILFFVGLRKKKIAVKKPGPHLPHRRWGTAQSLIFKIKKRH